MKLAKLLNDRGLLPVNSEGNEVELPLEGMEAKDLVAALAKGVFANEAEVSDPKMAAEEWVNRHQRKA